MKKLLLPVLCVFVVLFSAFGLYGCSGTSGSGKTSEESKYEESIRNSEFETPGSIGSGEKPTSEESGEPEQSEEESKESEQPEQSEQSEQSEKESESSSEESSESEQTSESGGTLVGSEGLEFDKNVVIGIGTCKDTDVVIPTYSPEGYLVTAIGDLAFYECSQLTNITIPNGVTSIGMGAFAACGELTNVTIPDSVTSIGEAAFYGCEKLNYNEYDNALYLGNNNNPYLVLIKAKDVSVSSCIIEAHTKFISVGAFAECGELTSVTIPDSVTHIGEGAFYLCDKLNYNEYDNALYLGNSENPYLAFFIRTKEQPDVPFVTVEYSIKQKLVLQCYGNHDSKPNDNVMEFVNKKWLPYANRKVRKIQKAA